jgi:hypothetical protein
MFNSRTGSVDEPDQFRRSPGSVSHNANANVIPVDRGALVRTRRSPHHESLYSRFQRGSGFRWQPDRRGDGQQQRRAVRHGLAGRGLETRNEPCCNLVEPQTRFGGGTSGSAARLEGCDLDGDPFPAVHHEGAAAIAAPVPRCRELSRDSFDGDSLLCCHSVVACVLTS